MNRDSDEVAAPSGRLVNSRLARFFLVGVAAAAINIFSRVLISYFVRFEYAVALAFPVALKFAFVMSTFFVFEASKRPVWEQYLRFALVNIIALVQVWLISVSPSEARNCDNFRSKDSINCLAHMQGTKNQKV